MSARVPQPPVNKANTGTPSPPPVGGTLLITSTSPPAIPSTVCEADAQTALKRGMKEYIEQLSIDHQGSKFSFAKVFDDWPEHETKVEFPSAIVYTTGTGTYDASSFTPLVNSDCITPDGQAVVKKSELVIDLQIEFTATNSEMRVALMKMLENALSPETSQYGVTLEFPHYFNQRGQYELISSQYPDTEADIIQRNRKAILNLSSWVPVVSLATFPLARPKVELTVEDSVESC